MFESIITIALICFVVYFLIKVAKKSTLKAQKQQEEERQKLLNETQAFVTQAQEVGSLPIISTSILLESGEQAHLQESVKLIEPKTVRHNAGAGGRVRIARGLSVGGWSGQSESRQEWRSLDVGTLILTNKRIFFKGQTENRVLPIKKIIEVGHYTDGIQISSESKTKSSVFTVQNPYLWTTCINFLKGV